MDRFLIKSKNIYTEDRIIDGGILVENGKIAALIEGAVLPVDCPVFDYGTDRVIPGFIETHNHGYYGWNAGGTVDDVKGYLRALPAAGVVGVLPTTGPGRMANIATVIEEGNYEGTRILGIHSFGPFLNEAKLALGTKRYDTEATREMVEEYYNESRGNMALMTLAPEIKGMPNIFDFLKEKGVIIAIGHTSGTYEETMWGIENGAKGFCHICNMTSPIHHRDIGATGAGLLVTDIYCELIGDFYHISQPMLELILKLKPIDRLMLMTDCGQLSGMQPGKYHRGDDPTRYVIIGEDGLMRQTTGRIAGSAMCNLFCLKHFVEYIGMPLEKAIRMTSLTAATYLGLDDHKGSIKVGKDADIVVLSDNYENNATFIEGNLCYTPDQKESLKNPDGPKPFAPLD